MYNRYLLNRHVYACMFMAFIFNACQKITETNLVKSQAQSSARAADKPNVIIILEDDIGYEVPTFTGGQSYSTPEIDMLAQSGMQFTHCYASAMCSPSRVMMLTGKYGFRNYHEWGVLDSTQKTIANLLRENGYATCVTGKWQLDGHFDKFGFNEHFVFDPFEEENISDNEENKHRYKNPTIYQNGAYLPTSATTGKYSDDMFADYASDFITRKKDSSFFLYFSFSECHLPFSPPPNNSAFKTYNPLTTLTNKKYLPYMVSYMDSKISTIMQTLANNGILNNTYIFIMGDNGTTNTITSKYNGRNVTGGKGTTTEFGLHVPLVLLGPGIQPGSVNRNIVDFSDFLPTIANIAGISQIASNYGAIDGKSFYNQFLNPAATGRAWSFGYYFPYPKQPKQKRIYVQDTTYKLYDVTNANRFYNVYSDSLEKKPIGVSNLTSVQKTIQNNFKNVLATMHN